ncbi:MAG: ParB N-terminal domain-containing protein, partial [Thermoguttaceae bacterium]|nr:ParB N-terminal domain-containing protein [Thermoguttaceae bacterium]
MEIVEVKTSDLTPYPGNPRRNESAVAGVAESIRRFGFKQPLVIGADGVIVCGHTRYEAAKRLGLETVPCVRADGLSDGEIRAYRLLDNRLHEESRWDAELLERELGAFEFDFSPFGVDFAAALGAFDPDEAEAPEPVPEPDAGEDAIPSSFELVVSCD